MCYIVNIMSCTKDNCKGLLHLSVWYIDDIEKASADSMSIQRSYLYTKLSFKLYFLTILTKMLWNIAVIDG